MAQTTIQGSFLGDGTVTGAKVAADFISAQTALASGLATTDEIIVSDAGVIKKIAMSVWAAATITLTNKSIDLGDNTLTGSVAEFNAALQSESFATLGGTEVLAAKTLTAPTVNAGTLNLMTALTVANDIDVGAYEVRALKFESDQATGTAPLTVASTTVVTNLNADLLDGVQGALYSQIVAAETLTNKNLATGNSGTIKLVDGDGNHFTTIAAHATTAADVAYTWPDNAPSTSGYALTSTTGGVMSWAAAGGISVNGTTDNALVTYDNGNTRLNTESNVTLSTISENLTLSIGAYLRMEGQSTSVSKNIQFRTTNGPEYEIEYRNAGLNFSEVGVAHYRLHIKDDGDITVLENASSPSVVKGIAKHWVKFNPSSTGTLLSSYNCDSVTDSNVGNWSVILNTYFSSTPYVITGMVETNTGISGGMKVLMLDGDPAGSEYYLSGWDDGDNRSDPYRVHMVAFGERIA